MPNLPSQAIRRASVPSIKPQNAQKRHASLIRRPHRPYTFTQLVTLSDGSSYLTRTTSPLPVYKSTKDTRNTVLWQPSLASLRNIEQDEAGRLRAFRARFGRGWDVEAAEEEEGERGAAINEGGREKEREGGLMDLISGKAGKREVVAEEIVVENGKEIKMVVVKKDGKLVKVPVHQKGDKAKK